MSDHLPECDWLWKVHREFISRGESGDRCTVCDALRACEARVRREVIDQPDTHATYVYRAGRAEGLDAARDAVAALSTPDDLTRQEALAAIDALRGES